MGNTRERIGAAGVALAKVIFRFVLYICVVLLIFWAGKYTYEFSYSVFNERAMSPGAGEEITVVIEDGSSVYKIGKTLESRGLIDNAFVFVVQEFLSTYHGKLNSGVYLLSSAYTPTRMMGILAGDPSQGGTEQNLQTAAEQSSQTEAAGEEEESLGAYTGDELPEEDLGGEES